ncbi:tetratricopeptide repeat protein [Candidatus Sumerlaeota bacterium]|nr:tetratricopeptide repeat protein [Candidatus Sumerlaeota bacterium]
MSSQKSKKSKGNSKGDKTPLSRIPAPIGSPFMMEQMHSIIEKVMKEKKFKDPKEMSEYLNKNLTGRPIEELLKEYPTSPKDVSRDLCYQAIDAKNPQEALKLLDKALELDPENIDALALLANFASEDDEDYAGRLEGILKCAESFLGEGYFEENKGHFWGLTETRPFMRAKQDLVFLLIRLEKKQEAIRHCEEMLELNPNDNQGIRDILLGLYLEIKNLDKARSLLVEYEEDRSAVFSWGKVLERFLSGDKSGALDALKIALTDNPFVQDYLLKKKKMPSHLPEYYSPGSKEEALVFMNCQAMAWGKNPDALRWLKASL